MLKIISNGIMTSSGMDISESFRPEDLGKTDFFDFVTTGSAAAEMTVNGGGSGSTGGSTSSSANGVSATRDRPPSAVRPGTGDAGGTSSNRNGPETINGGATSQSGEQTAASGSSGTGSSGNVGNNGNGNNQPLQGFDQFWGPDKDVNRLDQTMFDDINRYCWIQQQSSGSGQPSTAGSVSNAVTDTDGQIYTLTVLNGAPEPWVLRKDPSAAEPPPPAANLDLDTILGGFPGYVKTECFSYDDSGFGTDHHGKEDPQHQQQQQHLLNQQQQQHLHQQVQQIPVTSTNIVLSNSLMDPNSVIAYQNNNNDWQMSDHNVIEHETPESLLRSALQGKGYTKGTPVQLQNGITVIPAGQIKEEELRRVLYTGEADSLAYADSTLANPLFDETALHSPSSNNPQHPAHTATVGDLGSGVVVDDMFLTLDSAFTEDYEKLKRIATEVQQFCTDNNNYTEIIVESAAINQHQNPSLISSNNGNSNLVISSANQHAISTTTSSDVVTTTSTPKVKAPRTSKKYKRSLTSGASTTSTNSSSSIANNNNNSSMSNLNTTPASILSTTNHGSSNPSPTHCNGQRKERSLHYCSICSKGFKDKYSVNVHIRTHTGEKPFACSLCGKSFRQKAHLAKHYQTHMAQKNPSGSVKASKQNRAAAEQAAAAATAAASNTAIHLQQPSGQLTPTGPPPLIGQSQSPSAASILLNTAAIVASR
ncbi:zinc finger protein sens [Sabethes cyaneus]|uniref:zinc finger protein sens n=1 Tax=Sabethes cyaneus TaxID=53552 RepID=UPI00237E0A98|nr:zinc finger protein sens [Sabethes cyaneus]